MAKRCAPYGTCKPIPYWLDALYGNSGGGGGPVSAPVNTVLPLISGTTKVGSQLSTTTGTWNPTADSYTYQWKRNGTNISGATASTYTLVTADFNTVITVTVTATNTVGSTPATSVGTSAIIPLAPVNTVAPSISGNPNALSTLTAANGTFPGQGTINYTYQWQKNSVNISGATSSTYQPLFSDYGATIRVIVTATNMGGSTPANSSATAAIAWAIPVAVGTIFSDTFSGTLADYTIVGTGISIAGGQVTMTGNPTLFSSALTYTKATSPHHHTCLEKWTQTVRCTTPAALGSTVFGIGIGVRSTNTFDPYSTIVRWAWDNAAGTVNLYTKDTITGQITAGTTFTPVANTTYILEFSRNKNVFTFRILNASSVQQYTTTFTLNISTTNGAHAHNTGNFAIYNFGGTTLIDSWDVTSTAMRYCEIDAATDSIGYGLYAGSNANRYIEAAFTADGYTFEIMGGIADRTTEISARLDQLIYMMPRRLFLCIGRNDRAFGTAAATVNTNNAAIKSTLQAAGITVVTGRPWASNVDVSGVTGDIDFYTMSKSAGDFTLNATYNSGDSIHPNTTGHAAGKTLLQANT